MTPTQEFFCGHCKNFQNTHLEKTPANGCFCEKEASNGSFLFKIPVLKSKYLSIYNTLESSYKEQKHIWDIVKHRVVFWWWSFFEKIVNNFQSLTVFGNIAQKMKFSMKDFFSKCDQIHSFLRIWSHLLKKSVMENFIFWAVKKFIITAWQGPHRVLNKSVLKWFISRYFWIFICRKMFPLGQPPGFLINTFNVYRQVTPSLYFSK